MGSDNVLSVKREGIDVITAKREKAEAKSNDDWSVTIMKLRSSVRSQKYPILPQATLKTPKQRTQILWTSKPDLKARQRREVLKKPRYIHKAEMYKQLHNLKTILSFSNATPIRHQDTLGYACGFCTQKYQIPADLKVHTIVTHTDDDKSKFMKGIKFESFVAKFDITALQCKICESSVDGIEQLIPHLKEHGKEVFTDIKSHLIPFKFDKNELYCVHCLKTFDNFKLVYEHMPEHYRNYVCDMCASPFVTERSLRNHKLRHNTGEYKCDYCPKVFGTEIKRGIHHKHVHLGDGKRNKCLLCNEKFLTLPQKLHHMARVHGGDPIVYKCKACERSFNSKPRLVEHTKRVHLLEKRFKCPECDMSFFAKASLENHYRKHDGVKNFHCCVCAKSFARKKTLREHTRIHENDRRYKCEHCGQTFVQKCSWRSHMRSKHGEIV